MESSPEELGESARLAKSFHDYLGRELSISDLRRLGCLSRDHPKTPNTIEMAAAAFLYLGKNHDGSWNRNQAPLKAIMACLSQRTGKLPTVQDLQRLKAFLNADQLSERDIVAWFRILYR